MYLVKLETLEEICREIEQALTACGRSGDVGIVRSKFVTQRKVFWFDDVAGLPERELRLLDWSSVVPGSLRVHHS